MSGEDGQVHSAIFAGERARPVFLSPVIWFLPERQRTNHHLKGTNTIAAAHNAGRVSLAADERMVSIFVHASPDACVFAEPGQVFRILGESVGLLFPLLMCLLA